MSYWVKNVALILLKNKIKGNKMSINEKDSIKIIIDLLFSKYGKITLDATEVSEVLGISIKSLENARLNSTGIPYTRLNGTERGKPLYDITTIANEIKKRQVKIFS